MIVIDKNRTEQKIIVTVSSKASAIPSYMLHLKSTFTKHDYSFRLGTNLSEYPFRYDAFKFDLTDVDMEVGEYIYQITDNNRLLESGYAKVIDSDISATDVVTNYQPDEEVQYFIYNPTG